MVKARINQTLLDLSTNNLRALAHPLRMRIINYINNNDSVNVNKIYSALDLEQSITSQHLRILRNAQLVKTVREGKLIYYSLNHDKIDSLNKASQSFSENESER